MSLARPASQDIIIIGASGDLSRRKLLPPLYNLEAAELLPERGRIIGLARTDLGDERFRQFARESVQQFSRTGLDEGVWTRFAARLTFIRMDEEGYGHLRAAASEEERLVYLAIPPSVVAGAIRSLQEAGLVKGTRLVVEKPFGRDLASAKHLARDIHEAFRESQVFRIDH